MNRRKSEMTLRLEAFAKSIWGLASGCVMMLMTISLAACHSVEKNEEGQAAASLSSVSSAGSAESAGNDTLRQEVDIHGGIYYWKTTFELTDWDRAFLREHHITRLYMRFFDVDNDINTYNPVPVATTRFVSRVPDGVEIVPVVYLTVDALRGMDAYVEPFYKRVKAMCQGNGLLEHVHEIQLDCDWTSGTQALFFQFCSAIRAMAQEDGLKVSSTLRLHQLGGAMPPVDEAVLMLYNTGSLYSTATRNSILNARDVEPYLRSDISCAIPLSFAYPTYGWGILLRDGKFGAILHQTDFSDTSYYKAESENRIKVVKEHWLEDNLLKPGDYIRLEQPDMEDIRQVKMLVQQHLPAPARTIIYHLDSLNLSKYSYEEINTILR